MFSERLRLLRKKKHISQEQLAFDLNVARQTVSKWENGRSLPDPTLFQPLCDILEISLTELFNGERIEEKDVLEKSDEVLFETAMSFHRIYKTVINAVAIIFCLSCTIYGFYSLAANS